MAPTIVATLSQQLSWSRFVELIKVDAEVIELLDLAPEHIHVGEYWLELPPEELLRDKLHKAMIEARTRLELRSARDSE